MKKKKFKKVHVMSNFSKLTAWLTAWGKYEYRPLSPRRAMKILKKADLLVSSCEYTVNYLETILDYKVPYFEVQKYSTMAPGEQAIVLKFTAKAPPEDGVITVAELKALPYELGLLTMLE